jgi:hypothetical protein
VGDGTVSGWAWRPQAPRWRVGVRAILDGKEVAAGIADRERPTLARDGIGDGRHGFRFELPSPRGMGRHTLRVEAEDVPLAPAARYALISERKSDAWDGIELSVDGSPAVPEGAPLLGRIEDLHDGAVSGWVWSPSAPEWRPWVRVTVDGEDVGGGFADLHRASLVAMGIGDGGHGFSIELPSRPASREPLHLCIEAGGGVTLRAAAAFASDTDGAWRIVVSSRYR